MKKASIGISGNDMSVRHASISFPLLPPRAGERRAALAKPVAGRPICDRSPPSGGPDLIFATILQAERGGRREGRRLCNGCGRARATHAGAGGGWADSLAALSLSPSLRSLARSLTSHDDAVSLSIPASFLPSLLPSLLPPFLEPRAPRPRTESVDDDDDDEHTCSPARSLAREWTNCKVFSRENCATHAKAKKRPSVARSPRQVIRPGQGRLPASFEHFFAADVFLT